jgi:hypothetical protein
VQRPLHLVKEEVCDEKITSILRGQEKEREEVDAPLAPRKITELELTTFVPLTKINSSSLILSCTTSSANPSELASNVSSPSRFAKLETIVAPVALAIRRRSSFLQRRTAIAPASTNSLRQRSSIPLVVRMTLAPVARILRTRSRVMSDSLEGRGGLERGKKGGKEWDEPLADGLELVGVVDGDVNAEVHASLHQVHVEAGNLRAGDASLHGCSRMKQSVRLTAATRRIGRTLRGNSAVESVTLDVDRLERTLAVSLEDVNSLDGVLDVTTSVDGLDSKHGVDSEVSEEVAVTVRARQVSGSY